MASRKPSTPPSTERRSAGARSKHPKLLALLALAVMVAATLASILIDPKLGLDLRGGTQIVLEAQDSPTVKANADSTQRALEVLRRRVDALGVAEPTWCARVSGASSSSCPVCRTRARRPRSSGAPLS